MTPVALLTAVARLPPALLAASFVGWLALWPLGHTVLLPTICSGDLAAIVGGVLAFNSPAAWLLGWVAMLLAMMPPLLAMPTAYLSRRSLARRRWRAILQFTAGYGAIWLVGGAVLTALAVALRFYAQARMLPAAALVVALALVWQALPFKQVCLNRCHRQPRIGAFGLQADIDAMRFGVTHGVWCVGACWPLMLLPLTLDAGHLPAMGAVALASFAERRRLPRPARWGVAAPYWPTCFTLSSHHASRTLP